MKGSLWKQWADSEFGVFIKLLALNDGEQDEESQAIHPPTKEFVDSLSQSKMKKDHQERVATVNQVKMSLLPKGQV